MSLAQHYLDTAVELISSYKGEKPFPFVLKQFFSDKKKYGSRDRKMIGQLCFAYFRLGKAWAGMPAPDKMLKAFFLFQQQSHPLLKQLKPEWDEVAGNTTEEKLLGAGQQLCADDIFPWRQQTSSGIEFDRFVWAHLQQPLLFLRARPPHYNKLIQKLQQANIAGLTALPHNAIALPNGTKIEEWVAINREAVVQDLSSQQVGVIVQDVFAKQGFLPKRLWDCCAASGGKSIMLKDLYPALQLTVSDIRQSILHNLQQRFREAGILSYQSFTADLTGPDSISSAPQFDCIVADVPCTGSGTWARTPEQLCFFESSQIALFSKRQLTIASNALRQLKAGGMMVYITCSVFSAENEEVVQQLTDTHSLQLLHQQMIDGSAGQADSMFVAILQKSSHT